MKKVRQLKRWSAIAIVTTALIGAHGVTAQTVGSWPRHLFFTSFSMTLHEPDVEAYEDDWLSVRSAISVKDGDREPVFGAVWYRLQVTVDPDRRLARVMDVSLTVARFPDDAPVDADTLSVLLSKDLTGVDMPLDPLLQSLERERAAMAAADAGMDAIPSIVFLTHPARFIEIAGEPELEVIAGTDVLKVMNTAALIVLKQGTGRWFLRLDSRWLSAGEITGPWLDTDLVPDSVLHAAEAYPETRPETQQGRPQVIVTTELTEIIETAGDPRYTVIPGTTLLYVINTDSDVFLNIADQQHYVLLAGRWFATASLADGPWVAVPSDRLPETFAAIPPDSPKYGVLVHVAGTSMARQATLDASLPQTRVVRRTPSSVTVVYNGDPSFVEIPNTTVYYAVNTPYSVMRVSDRYYLCDDAVWYWGLSAVGPWDVCISVPGVIYTIPPTCPLYPVTYVRVYDSTPSVVYVGYTSGYYGWYPSPYRGSLVFGFAYYDSHWYRRSRPSYYGYRSGHPYRAPYHGYHYGRPYQGSKPSAQPGRPFPGGNGGSSAAALGYRNRRDYHRYEGTKPGSAYGPSRSGLRATDARSTPSTRAATGKAGTPGRGLPQGMDRNSGKPGAYTAPADRSSREPPVSYGNKTPSNRVPEPQGSPSRSYDKSSRPDATPKTPAAPPATAYPRNSAKPGGRTYQQEPDRGDRSKRDGKPGASVQDMKPSSQISAGPPSSGSRASEGIPRKALVADTARRASGDSPAPTPEAAKALTSRQRSTTFSRAEDSGTRASWGETSRRAPSYDALQKAVPDRSRTPYVAAPAARTTTPRVPQSYSRKSSSSPALRSLPDALDYTPKEQARSASAVGKSVNVAGKSKGASSSRSSSSRK